MFVIQPFYSVHELQCYYISDIIMPISEEIQKGESIFHSLPLQDTLLKYSLKVCYINGIKVLNIQDKMYVHISSGNTKLNIK